MPKRRKNMKNLVILLFFSGALLFTQKKQIALIDFYGNDVDKSIIKNIQNNIENNLIKDGTYKIIDRNNISKILTEQQIQLTGITENFKAVEIGRLLNAEYLLLGEITTIKNQINLFLKLIHIESATVKKAESIAINNNYQDIVESFSFDDKVRLMNFENTCFLGFTFGDTIEKVTKLHGNQYSKIEPNKYSPRELKISYKFPFFIIGLNKNNKIIQIQVFSVSSSAMCFDKNISFGQNYSQIILCLGEPSEVKPNKINPISMRYFMDNCQLQIYFKNNLSHCFILVSKNKEI